MNWGNGTVHFSHIGRYREIANVLVKHGFGFLFDRLSLQKIVGRWKVKEVGEGGPGPGTPQRLRMALVELGPAFVKLGQLLSIRPDLLGPEYIAELEKLQNEVPPVSFQAVMDVCRDSGIQIEQEFAHVDPVPLAAASIAQVHRAVLKSGEEVVLKVQRPGIARVIETDLLILADMGRLLEKRTAWGSLYKVSEIVAELSSAVRRELDFEQEARNADIFYNNYRNDPHVLIPRVYWDYTNRRLLTMEYIAGTKITDFITLPVSDLKTADIAKSLLASLYTQIYERGFFHADPHPGNIAVSPSGQIIYYDFGQVGVLDHVLKEECINLLLGMIDYDAEAVTRALLAIGIGTRFIRREDLIRDVARLEKKYYGMPLAQIKLGEAMAELLELSTRYQVRVPAELSLVVKMLMTIESIVTQLDPQISLVKIAGPYGRRVLMHRYSPRHLATLARHSAQGYARLARDLPDELERILDLVSEGEIKLKMEINNMEKVAAKFDVMSNRVSLAIILASLLMGTALIADDANSVILARLPVVELGFLAAFVLGLFLTWSIIKSGRF